jgi:hypothetical protein
LQPANERTTIHGVRRISLEPLYHRRPRKNLSPPVDCCRATVDLVRSRSTTGHQGGNPMQYLLLIYDNEKLWETMTEADGKKVMGEYFAFTEEIKKAGKYVAGDALQPTHTATTVRVRDGKRLTTDGPFAETKEQLGGYYLVEANDLDEAIAIAAKIPSAKMGSIEVRPVQKFD